MYVPIGHLGVDIYSIGVDGELTYVMNLAGEVLK
jgi:hypothetical protein